MIIAEYNSLFQTRKYLRLLFSVFFGAVLASLPIDKFIDRDNYLNYLGFGAVQELLLSSSYESAIALFFNEPLWLAVNAVLPLFLDAEDALRLIIFFSAFVFYNFIFSQLKSSSKKDLLLFLFLAILGPQILKNYILHLRQGMAISVFLAILSFDGKNQRSFFVAAFIAALIHSSFFLLLFISVITLIFDKMKFDIPLRVVFMAAILGISAALFKAIAVLLQARQAEYDMTSDEGSGLGFLFWFLILFLFLLPGLGSARFDKNKWLEFSVYAMLLYLVFYFVTPMSARIFENCLPFVIISAVDSKERIMIFAKIALVILCVYQWMPGVFGGSVFRLAGT